MAGLIKIALLSLAAASSPSLTTQCEKPDQTNLVYEDFDQNPKKGWRLISTRVGCYREAADSIARWLDRNKSSKQQRSILLFHEAQMRAAAGQGSAVSLFISSKLYPDWIGWNNFVDANIAFLKSDRKMLSIARQGMLSTPLPSTHEWLDDNGHPIPPYPLRIGESWPPNIAFVDTLSRCIGNMYYRVIDGSCK